MGGLKVRQRSVFGWHPIWKNFFVGRFHCCHYHYCSCGLGHPCIRAGTRPGSHIWCLSSFRCRFRYVFDGAHRKHQVIHRSDLSPLFHCPFHLRYSSPQFVPPSQLWLLRASSGRFSKSGLVSEQFLHPNWPSKARPALRVHQSLCQVPYMRIRFSVHCGSFISLWYKFDRQIYFSQISSSSKFPLRYGHVKSVNLAIKFDSGYQYIVLSC